MYYDVMDSSIFSNNNIKEIHARWKIIAIIISYYHLISL